MDKVESVDSVKPFVVKPEILAQYYLLSCYFGHSDNNLGIFSTVEKAKEYAEKVFQEDRKIFTRRMAGFQIELCILDHPEPVHLSETFEITEATKDLEWTL